jgi:hypothetical protein
VKDQFGKLTDKIDSIGTDGTRFKKLNVPIRAMEQLRTKHGVPELTDGDTSEVDDEF